MSDTLTVCPYCNSAALIALDGATLCGNCRKEWSNDDPPAVIVWAPVLDGWTATDDDEVGTWDTREAAALLETKTLDGTLRGPDIEPAPDTAQAALDAIVGAEVELEGGQRAHVLGFPDDDHVDVLIGRGEPDARTEVVPIGDVVREISRPPITIDVPDNAAVQIAGACAAVAVLALRAGVASIDFTATPPKLAMPPNEWLPTDADMAPVTEDGIAYAIAALVLAMELPRDAVETVIDGLSEAAQAGMEQENEQ